jgi:hypothetical protein
MTSLAQGRTMSYGRLPQPDGTIEQSTFSQSDEVGYNRAIVPVDSDIAENLVNAEIRDV